MTHTLIKLKFKETMTILKDETCHCAIYKKLFSIVAIQLNSDLNAAFTVLFSIIINKAFDDKNQ